MYVRTPWRLSPPFTYVFVFYTGQFRRRPGHDALHIKAEETRRYGVRDGVRRGERTRRRPSLSIPSPDRRNNNEHTSDETRPFVSVPDQTRYCYFASFYCPVTSGRNVHVLRLYVMTTEQFTPKHLIHGVSFRFVLTDLKHVFFLYTIRWN